MKTFRAVSLSLLLFAPVLLTSCADCWHDYWNKDNPPPDTPAVDPVEPEQTPSVVLLTDDQLVRSATQSLILALTRKGLTGTGMNAPQNSIYADRIYRALIDEAIVKYGSDYVLEVSAPNDEGMDVTVAKEIGGSPVIHIAAKRRR